MQQAARSGSWEAGLEARLLLVAIFLFALLVRLAVIGATVGFQAPAAIEPTSDSRIHMALVESLLAGRGYSLEEPTAITPPLYVFLLAGLYRLFDSPAVVRLLQAGLAAGGCVILYAIGRRMFDHTTGLFAAGLLSLHPLAAYVAGVHLTENLFLFLVLLVIWQAVRVEDRPTTGAAAWLGGFIGLGILTRSVFLAFLPFVLVWAAAHWGTRDRHASRVFAVVLAAALVVVSPWTVRNYVVLGALVPVQSNGGMVFWAGNNPHSDGGMVWPGHKTWTATRPPDDDWYGWRDLTVAQENALYLRTALSWIGEHPGDFLRLLARKLARLYGFARAADDQGLRVPAAVRLVQAGFLAAALTGMVMTLKSWRRLSLLVGFVLFTNVTTVLFSGATRYSIPMLPSLALFAAVALAAGWKGLNGGGS